MEPFMEVPLVVGLRLYLLEVRLALPVSPPTIPLKTPLGLHYNRDKS